MLAVWLGQRKALQCFLSLKMWSSWCNKVCYLDTSSPEKEGGGQYRTIRYFETHTHTAFTSLLLHTAGLERCHFVQRHFVARLIGKKEWIPSQGRCLCDVSTFSPRSCAFLWVLQVFPPPKDVQVRRIGVSKLFQSEGAGCMGCTLQWKGLLSRVGSHVSLCAAGTGSHDPKLEQEG